MQIKALIFDFGGVLMRTVDQTPRRRWEIRCGLPKLGLAKLVFDNPVARQATIGDAQSSDIWNYVGLALGLSNGELTDLESDFWKGDKINSGLVDYVRTHSVAYRPCILSNAWPDARNLFDSITDLKIFEEIMNFNWFDLLWLMKNLHWFILMLAIGVIILFFFPLLLGYDLKKKADISDKKIDE